MSCNTCNCTPCCCSYTVKNTCAPVYCPPAPCPPPLVTPPPDLLFARVAISPQDFFIMPGAQKMIILPPGTGKMISPVLTWAILDFKSTSYDDGFGNPPQLIFYIGGNIPFTDSQVLGQTVQSSRFYTLSQNVFTPAIGIQCIQDFTNTFDNQPLTVSTNLLPLNGDSTLYIYCLYSIVTI